MKKLLCLLAALLLLCPAGLAENSKECEILLPDGYTGTLPVYRATLRDESAVRAANRNLRLFFCAKSRCVPALTPTLTAPC